MDMNTNYVVEKLSLKWLEYFLSETESLSTLVSNPMLCNRTFCDDEIFYIFIVQHRTTSHIWLLSTEMWLLQLRN